MYRLLLLVVIFTVFGCGEDTPIKSFPFSNVNVASFQASSNSPRLEQIKVNHSDKDFFEVSSGELYELQFLSSYLVQRSFYNKYLNELAPMKASDFSFDSQGIMMRIPTGLHHILKRGLTSKLELTISDFPYQHHKMFYVWFDVQEQKEVSGRYQLDLNSGGFLTNFNNIKLDSEILHKVSPTNLRLILLSDEKSQHTQQISIENVLGHVSLDQSKKLSGALDMSKRVNPVDTKNLRTPFWICANCSDSDQPKLYIETNLELIYEAANIGEIAKRSSKSMTANYNDLRLGDEVEVTIETQVNEYTIGSKSTRYRYHHIPDFSGIKNRASTLCEYRYQEILYQKRDVSFDDERMLSRVVLKIDELEMTALSYYYHYPQRFYRNNNGQLVMNYSNRTQAKSFSISFLPDNRAQTFSLSGEIVNTAGRRSCVEALDLPVLRDLKRKINTRTVRAQDVYDIDLGLRVFGVPRI